METAASNRLWLITAEAQSIGKLSKRESQWTELAAHGLTDKEIAREMGASEQYAKHLSLSARFKLNAKRRTDLVAIAIRQGFLVPLLIIISICAPWIADLADQTYSDLDLARHFRIQRSPRGRKKGDLESIDDLMLLLSMSPSDTADTPWATQLVTSIKQIPPFIWFAAPQRASAYSHPLLAKPLPPARIAWNRFAWRISSFTSSFKRV